MEDQKEGKFDEIYDHVINQRSLRIATHIIDAYA